MEMSWGKSDSIAQLAAALSVVQGKIKGAVKGQSNPFYNSSYADLSACWDACREHLSANGLAIIQLPSAQGSTVRIPTVLVHSSGEWVSSELTMTAEKGTPQAVGSAITYGRRYGLCAIVGIAPEDDDGNAAEGLNGRAAKPKKARAGEHQSDDCDQCFEEGVPAGETVIHQKNGHTYLTKQGDEHRNPNCPGCKKSDVRQAAAIAREKPDNGNPKMTGAFKVWLDKMAEAKKRVGDTMYYRILGSYSFQHANEVKDPATQLKIRNELAELYNSAKVFNHPTGVL